MRKVIFFMLTSVDGFFEGAGHNIDWHHVDEEFNEFANEQLGSTDMLLFGRVTYEMMASYWPTEQAKADDPEVAGAMNALQKIVVSTTLDTADWENTRLVKDNLAEEVGKLKQQVGKDMIVMGSSGLAVSLAEMGLVDEFRIMVNPVVLGEGKPVFSGIHGRLNLKLLKARTFGNGNVLLYYAPAADAE